MASEQKIIQDLDKAFSGLTVTLEALQKVLAQNKAAQQEQIQYIESLKKAIGDSREWKAFAAATENVSKAQKELAKVAAEFGLSEEERNLAARARGEEGMRRHQEEMKQYAPEKIWDKWENLIYEIVENFGRDV